MQFARLAILGVGLAILAPEALAQTSVTGLISRDEAGRHGLVRAWAVQVGVGGGRDRVAGVVCAGDVVAVYTERGVLQVIDAERGISLWTRQVGTDRQNSFAPSVNATHVAFIHGRALSLLDRADGRELWSQDIEGVPSASPALGSERVFVPTQRGRLMSLSLADPDDKPWFFAASGAIEVSPVVTPTSVIWGTTSGIAFCSAQDKAKIRFQLITRGSITAPMASRAPLVFIASHDYELYAIDEHTGAEQWRFATGSQVRVAPLATDDLVLLAPETGDLHCLGALDGDVKWTAQGVVRVASVSPQRVYGIDPQGQLQIVDRATGATLGRLATSRLAVPVTNAVNDRIYLASANGLVQCLREAGLERPALTQTPPAAAPKDGAEEAGNEADAEAP